VPLFVLDGAVSLRRPLGGDVARGPFRVEELAREAIERVLAGDPELACSVGDVDAAAPAAWRCFVAFAGERPVHRAFVALRPGAPLLFGAVTRAGARGQGAFRATVGEMAARLRPTGAPYLYSATSRGNLASLRAHRAAGFEITAVALDPVVAGVSLRRLARRLLDVFCLQCGKLTAPRGDARR
jgi:hypothetical protein